jgi:ferredoxin-NADP reductase
MSVEIPRTGSEYSSPVLADALSSTAAPMLYREHEANLVVAQKETVAEGVIALTLADANERELPDWTPGAHIDLILPGPELTRQYSLCSNPSKPRTWRIGVRRDAKSRGGSEFIHDVLKVGDTVQVRGPRNHFSLVDAPHYLFIAGGIGITPIRALMEDLGAGSVVVYRVVHEDDVVFRRELDAIADARGITLHYVVGDHRTEEGRNHLSPAHLRKLVSDIAERDVYVCGPPALTDVLEANVRASGVSKRFIHSERFAL